MAREYDRQNAEITRVTEGRRSMVAAEDRRIYAGLKRSAHDRAKWERQLSTLPDVLAALLHIGNAPGGWSVAYSITGLSEDAIHELYRVARRLRDQEIDQALGV